MSTDRSFCVIVITYSFFFHLFFFSCFLYDEANRLCDLRWFTVVYVIQIPVISSNHHGISESCHSNSSHVIKSMLFKFQSFHQIIMEFQSHVIQIPVMSSYHHGISELCHSNSSHVIKSLWDFRVLSFKFQSCHQFIMEFQPL